MNGTSDGKGENGATKKSAIVSVLGVEAPRVAGGGAPGETAGADAEFWGGGGGLGSPSPPVNQGAGGAGAQAGPAGEY